MNEYDNIPQMYMYMCFYVDTLIVFINNPQDERTPLHLAKDTEVVGVLVDAGADVNAKDKVRK